MRNVLALLLLLLLQGCFFLYVPGSLIDKVGDSLSGDTGNMCVTSTAVVGMRIRRPDGSMSGTVEKLEGPSRRCTDPAYPVRAFVKLDV